MTNKDQIEQALAHRDEGGRFSHENAVEFLTELARLTTKERNWDELAFLTLCAWNGWPDPNHPSCRKRWEEFKKEAPKSAEALTNVCKTIASEIFS